MKDQLISFKTAKLAKEKGFNEFCYSLYQNSDILLKDCFEYNPSLKYYNSDYKPSEHNTNWYLSNACSAPTQSLLQKWLREEHNIDIEIELTDNSRHSYYEFILKKQDIRDYSDEDFFDQVRSLYTESKFNTYEQALEKGLFEALKLIKDE